MALDHWRRRFLGVKFFLFNNSTPIDLEFDHFNRQIPKNKKIYATIAFYENKRF